MFFYVLLFFGETFTLYLYSYGWDKMQGRYKGWHLFLGVLLNVFGTAIMFVSNSWLSYQTSPATQYGVLSEGRRKSWIAEKMAADPSLTPETAMEGVTSHTMVPLHNETTGEFMGTVWDAVNNFTWMPVNIHRLVGNIAFGRFNCCRLCCVPFSRRQDERGQSTLRLDGVYWKLHRTLWAYSHCLSSVIGSVEKSTCINNTMGINMMGSLFSWLFIIQACDDWVYFLSVQNYYLWSGHGTDPRRGDLCAVSSVYDHNYHHLRRNLDDPADTL